MAATAARCHDLSPSLARAAWPPRLLPIAFDKHDPNHNSVIDSDSGMQLRGGETKKKGAGGKFTWGAVLSDTSGGPNALDKDDPNYDSADDAIVQEVVMTDGEDDEGMADSGQQTSSRIVQAVAELKLEVCFHSWRCLTVRIRRHG